LAKLTKDLLTHSEKHKVNELKYEEQAGKRRLYFHNWLTRLAAVIKMFPQTAPVLAIDNEIVLFPDPTCIGNRALYMLLCSKVDNFYRTLIQREHNLGDRALKLLKSYCASCTLVDKNHFHREFTNLRLSNDETATHFLKRFTIARTKAIIADNIYSDDETVDLFLAALAQTKNVQYLYVIQHYMSERQSECTVLFHDLERRLLAIDESSERETFTRRRAKVALGLAAGTVPDAAAHATTAKQIICYNCGKPGHKVPECPEPKKQQANHASSTGHRGGGHGPGRGNGRHRNKGRGGGKLQQANASTEKTQEPEIVVHGCSARVINFDAKTETTPDMSSPSALGLQFVLKNYIDGTDNVVSPEDIDTFDPDFITWNLNISEVFTTKMELTDPKLTYGNNCGFLQEPIIIIKHYDPLTSLDHTATRIVRPGVVRSASK